MPDPSLVVTPVSKKQLLPKDSPTVWMWAVAVWKAFVTSGYHVVATIDRVVIYARNP